MNKLTKNGYWNKQYKDSNNKKHTVGVKINLATAELDKVFKKYLSKNEECKFIEIGCAPGRWMHYFNKKFGYKVDGIEYAKDGVEMTRRNLRVLNVDGTVYEDDFLKNKLPNGVYDVVFSWGFIEHFDNVDDIIEKHVRLLKKGGILIVGVPNYNRESFNYFFQRILRKTVLDKHNLDIMNLEYFSSLGDKFGLSSLTMQYVGKINFGLFVGRRIFLFPGYFLQLFLSMIYNIFKGCLLRDNNITSPYIIAIYEVK